MSNNTDKRLNIVKIFCVCMSIVIGIRLIDLQIINGEDYRAQSESIKTRTIVSEAPRGNIVDRFGRVIAENKISYSVMLMKANVEGEILNDVILATINLIEKNGDTFIDELPILTNPTRFTFTDEEMVWKATYKIPQEATPMEAFKILRQIYNIDPTDSDEKAYIDLSETHSVSLPFELEDTQFKYEKKLDKWKKSNKIDLQFNAQQSLDFMLESYKIDIEKYGLESARKILSVRYLLKQSSKNYMPIEIASDIKEATRVAIEEAKIFLDGISITTDTTRSYPNGEFASHIIGYMNKISSDDVEEYLAKGYSSNAVVGKSGIEFAAEDRLKGKDGQQVLEVDNKGNLLEVIDIKEAIPGDTVFLTIDNKLQASMEASLLEAMKTINKGITSGAAVALDVNTGAVLAMSSEPGFDPNLFSNGITTKDWNALQPKTDDIHEPKPLINNAISYPMPPGSIMKMVAATAALETGAVSPNEKYICRGYYTGVANTKPRCAHGAVHGAVDMYTAIRRSCNVYFYEMGRRIGGDAFEKYADMYGFGQRTGIELPFEYKGNVMGPQHKKDLYKDYLNSYLKNKLDMEETLRNEICKFIDAPPSKKVVLTRLKELGITDKTHTEKIWNYINDSKWQPGDVLNATIGQGLNNVTPLQMVNYIATLANGGTRYKPYIIQKSVSADGVTVETQPEVVTQIDITPSNLAVIQEGMRQVIHSNGTAGGSFAGTGIEAAGKTGTAQAGKYRPNPTGQPNYWVEYPDHSWFVAYAPFDDPQIAVAVVIFQGGSGSKAIPVARDIIQEYLTPTIINDNEIITNDIIP